jgi:hypothetical protein
MRKQLQGHGAKVLPKAILLSWRGISLGPNTLVYSHVMLGGSSMGFDDAFWTWLHDEVFASVKDAL